MGKVRALSLGIPMVIAVLTVFAGTARADSTPEEVRLAKLQTTRIQEMARLSLTRDAQTPFKATLAPTGEESIVLPPRLAPYSIPELRTLFPTAFREAGGFLVLESHLVVAAGGSLHIDGPLDLRLVSGPNGTASIAGVSATIRIGGGGPVSISSWDPETQAPDQDPADGRAFILTSTGQMNISDSTFRHLGFAYGVTSGVAWKGAQGSPSGGDVSRSRFENNYFGAYTFLSEGMRWTDNVFANNMVYGFDPHDFSNYFVVERNEAFGNGKHGIIFSRGCKGNVITGNLSHDNGLNGIVLDDGKVLDDGDPQHAFAIPSDENVIENNRVWNNGGVGIALEGGSGNVVRGNEISGSRYGIRLKDNASRNQVVGNTISGSLLFAVYAYNGSDDNEFSSNRVTDGAGGFVFENSARNRVIGNQVSGIDGHAVSLIGNVGAMEITDNFMSGVGSGAVDLRRVTDSSGIYLNNDVSQWDDRWLPNLLRHHPLLTLWIVVLLVPLILGSLFWTRRQGRWVGRRMQRSSGL